MPLFILLLVVFGIPRSIFAENVTIQGTDCAMRGENGVIYLQDASGTDLMQITGIDIGWEPPDATGGTLEQISPNQLAIDYNIQNDTSGEVSVYAVYTCIEKKITANFTMTTPAGLDLGGTEILRHAISSTANSYFSNTKLRRHDYNTAVSIFEKIIGNASWKDNWTQHIQFTSIGNNTYTCSIDFTIAPHTIQGNDCRMRADNGVIYIQNDSNTDLIKLSGIDLGWTPPTATGGSVELISPNQLAIDYDIQNDSTGLISVYAVYTCTDNTITANFTLNAPTGTNLGGTEIFRQALSTTGNTYFSDTKLRRHDYSTAVSVFETINGNASWKDTYNQHVSFTDVGNDTYTCSIDFIVAPHTIKGTECAMHGDNGIIYIQNANSTDLIKISGIDIGWEPPDATGGSIELISPNQLAIDYNIQNDSTGLVSVYAVYTCIGKTIHANFTMTVPDDFDLGGTEIFRQALSTTGNAYFSGSKLRRHDYSTAVSVFEQINGNASWKDTYNQHISFTDIGDDTYTCSIDFNVAPHLIKGTNVAMRADNGEVFIQNASGTDLMKLSGMNLGWSPPVASGGTVELISPNQMGIEYDITNDTSGEVTVYGVYTCEGKTVTANLTLTIPSSMNIGGTEILRRSINHTDKTLDKIGRWTRHDGDGAAFEVRSAYLRRYDFDQSVSLFEQINGNAGWQDNINQNIHFADNGDGSYSSSIDFTVDANNRTSQAIAEHINDQQAAIQFSNSYQPFNLWEQGQTPQVTVQLTNIQDENLMGTLYITARDFDGNILVNTQQAIDLAAWQTFEKAYNIPLANTPSIGFVEATLIDGETEICFAQTNVGVLHDYTYTHKQDSNFGISAYFDIPTADMTHALMKRMGIRWDRSGDTTQTATQFDAISCFHNNVSRTQWSDDAAAKNAFFQDTLADCDARQNPYWEFGNEWNMSSLNTGTYSDVYVNDWLVPLTAQRSGYDVQIMSMGIAGADTAFLNGIATNGGWSMIDAVAMHPGRGNYTPDMTGGGWKYLGAIQAFKNAINTHGYKPLWLTEVYACTIPNSGWKDSYRRAAENIILTYAIGVAEDIKGVEFYQLHDSVWNDKGGVNPSNSEYHYGILYRDGTLKPSLLAFCNIAQALDGAVFSKYMSFTNSNIKGIQFNTPNGNMAVLWNRADGFVYNDSAELDPWLDHWNTQTSITVNSTQSSLEVIDTIGRSSTIPVSSGQATLTLTGAPVIVYGMTAQ